MKAFISSRGQAKRAIPAARPMALTSKSFASYSAYSCAPSCMRANPPAVIGEGEHEGSSHNAGRIGEAFELFAVILTALLATYTKGS